MPGHIPESISFGVLALARDWGAEPGERVRLPDIIAEMNVAAATAIERADLVVVTGGASVGEKDFARAMFEPLGLKLLFSKVAMKPGKPVWLGRAGRVLVLGSPGNPTSALVTARLFLAPLIVGLAGRDPAAALRWRTLPIGTRLPACGSRETFVRARWDGQAAEPVSNQDSSAQKALAGSDLLLRRRANAGATEPGTLVDALDL
jgi:molybdopterin molybdotransferase